MELDDPTTVNPQLVADIAVGDADAIAELLFRHGAEVHAVAFLILRNQADAEEVLADTVVAAWRKIETLRDPDRLRAWLLTTATRAALRRRRNLRDLVSLDRGATLTSSDPDPVARLAVAEAIDRLPPRMRAVVALHYVADLSVPAIARSIGRSENTVKSQLRVARSKLRAWLTEAPGRSENWRANDGRGH